jgi:hypothetical protein
MTVYINGEPVTAAEFAWDGCHKIYLINSLEDRERMVGLGYGEGESEILPIDELPEVWEESCGLRFISGCGPDYTCYVEQFEDAEVRSD